MAADKHLSGEKYQTNDFRIAGINLKFVDLTYAVAETRKTKKLILDHVSGEFRSGQITGLLGQSGSGKSTLLNVLAGYKYRPTSGHIFANNKVLMGIQLRKYARYVLQDIRVNPHLTVGETLKFAAKLKFHPASNEIERLQSIQRILEHFHLTKQTDTLASKLSGGEKKRLTLAVELLQPSEILFLDEPTTGLDEFSATQCIRYLKRLADAGHTIICSIHSPSAKLLEMFDKMYVLTEGQCVYQGPVCHIVPYLQQFELQCPINYNPADFIIEVNTHAYGNYRLDMVNAIENGKINNWLLQDQCEQLQIPEKIQIAPAYDECRLAWWSEFKWLLKRNVLHIWRDKANLYLRFFANLAISLLFGIAYKDLGEDGSWGYYYLFMCLATLLLGTFISLMPMVWYVPSELRYVRGEVFNRWYRLSAYFLALIAALVPLTLLMGIVTSAPVYLLTHQPSHAFRFLLFYGIVTLSQLMTASFGILIGTRFSIVNGFFVASMVAALAIILSYQSTEKLTFTLGEKILLKSSFFRHALEGTMASLLKFDRQPIDCPPDKIICLFSKPEYIMKLTGFREIDYVESMVIVSLFCIVFMAVAFYNLHCRLSGKMHISEQFYYYSKMKRLISKRINLNI